MRIGLITPGFSANEADWCIPAFLNLVRILAQQHEVHVFSLRYPHVKETYTVYGATVHAFDGRQVRGLPRLPLLGRVIAQIVRHGRQRRFDILHGLFAHEPGFVAVAAGSVLGVPQLVSVLGGELVSLPDINYGGQLSRLGWSFVRLALHTATRVSVGSSFLYRLAQSYVPPQRLLQLPLGIDSSLFCPPSVAPPLGVSPLAKGRVKLLHVASLVPVKDQMTLLHALATLVPQLPEVHLHIVGEGQLHQPLVCLANKLRLAPHVSFHGSVPHHQLPAYYRAADVCVLSSRYESQGMVTLEAAACGRSTVGTAVGILPEMLSGSEVVPVQSPEALATAIRELLPAAAAAGQASYETVKQHYTVEHTTAAFYAAYETLVSG